MASAASDPPCINRTTRVDPPQGRVYVYYCKISRPSYVYSAYSEPCHLGICWNGVGKLNKAGYANWFVCQAWDTIYAPGYNHNWARTLADNGRWGWVSAWNFAGSSDTWPLPACSTADRGGLYGGSFYP